MSYIGNFILKAVDLPIFSSGGFTGNIKIFITPKNSRSLNPYLVIKIAYLFHIRKTKSFIQDKSTPIIETKLLYLLF